MIKQIFLLYGVETKKDAGGCLIDLAMFDKDNIQLLKTYSYDITKKDPLVGL